MKRKEIKLVKDFSKKPFGRYRKDFEDRSGQAFREKHLAPNLEDNGYVHVILDGYNRYGRSFIDEAFGGLVREEGFEKKYLDEHLTYSHSLLDSVVSLIKERIEIASKDLERK